MDRVLIAQSSASFPASSQEQFYVSASRGREGVRVYTDDKEALKERIARSGQRGSATELLAGKLRADAKPLTARRDAAADAGPPAPPVVACPPPRHHPGRYPGPARQGRGAGQGPVAGKGTACRTRHGEMKRKCRT